MEEPLSLPDDDQPARGFFRGASSWLTSAVLHLLLLLITALITLPTGTQIASSLVISLGPEADASEALFTLDQDPITVESTGEQPQLVEVEAPLETLLNTSPAELNDPTTDRLPLVIPQPADLGGDLAKVGDAMFFGTSASGRDFVFILDISGSMMARKGERFNRARDELVESVSRLRPDQRFYVFLFNWTTIPMFGLADPGELIPASGENIAQLRAWLYSIEPTSGTDPRFALVGALKLQPNAIFLLSDGRFNTSSESSRFFGGDRNLTVFEVITKGQLPSVQINTIAFEDLSASQGMSKLAELTDGQFRFVPAPGQAGLAPVNVVDEPDYEPKTDAERLAMAEAIILLRRAERLKKRGSDEHARNLVKDIDPLKLPKDVRSRLSALR